MSFTAFLYGFFSAFVFLGVLVVVGGKKGAETIKLKLEELKRQQRKSPKALDAAKLDAVKLTSTIGLHVHGVHKSDEFVQAKVSLSGPKLRINLVESDGVADQPVAILTVASLLGTAEDRKDPPSKTLFVTSKDPTVPLFKDDQHGGANWQRADFRFETVRELERWQNVLHANERTVAWKAHVKSLPTIDVFNVFLSRILFELNNGPEFTELISGKIKKKLRAVKLPLKGTLTLNDIALGREIPYISGVSFLSYNTTGEIAFDFNLSYKGGFYLQLVAQLELKGILLPAIIISVSIETLEGNLHLSIGAPPSNKAWIGFHEAPKIQLTLKQQIHTGPEKGILGHIVSAIPDLSDLISDVVKVKLFEDMILPNMDDLPLPDVKDSPPSTPVTQSIPTPDKHSHATKQAALEPAVPPSPVAGGGGGKAHSVSSTLPPAPSPAAAAAAVDSTGEVEKPLVRRDTPPAQSTKDADKEKQKAAAATAEAAAAKRTASADEFRAKSNEIAANLKARKQNPKPDGEDVELEVLKSTASSDMQLSGSNLSAAASSPAVQPVNLASQPQWVPEAKATATTSQAPASAPNRLSASPPPQSSPQPDAPPKPTPPPSTPDPTLTSASSAQATPTPTPATAPASGGTAAGGAQQPGQGYVYRSNPQWKQTQPQW